MVCDCIKTQSNRPDQIGCWRQRQLAIPIHFSVPSCDLNFIIRGDSSSGSSILKN
jgi:hypothetical protein